MKIEKPGVGRPLLGPAKKKHLLVKTKLVEEAFLWEKFLGGESKKKDFFFV